MNALYVILTTALTTLSVFFVVQSLKKRAQTQQFLLNSNRLMIWQQSSNKRSMRNIVLRGDRPFSVIFGFRLNMPILGPIGLVWYGIVDSNENGDVVISAYHGKKSCDFMLYVNTDPRENHITITSSDDDQALTANATYPPHWYQRLGFFG